MASVTFGPSAATGPGWSNITRVEVEDGSSATNSVTARSNSGLAVISFTSAGLASTDVIDGIEVTVKASGSAASWLSLSDVSLPKGSSQSQSIRTWGSTLANQVLGGPTDLWGASWAPADFNSSWSLQFRVYNDRGTSVTANVDYVSVTIYYHAGTQEINPALLSVTPTLYGPSLTEILQPALLTVPPTLYSPALTEIVQPSLLTVSPTLYTPTLIQSDVVQPGLLTVTPTLYSPALTEIVQPSLLTVSPTFYTPTLSDVVLPSLLTTTPTLYSPALTEIIQPALLTVTPVLYAPAVGDAIDVPLLTITPTLYTPSLTEIIQPALLAVTPVLYTPRVAGPVTYIHPLRIRLSGADILRTQAHSPTTRARGNDAALRVRRTP